MPVLDGTGGVKTVTGVYDFAVDGGAAGTLTLRNGSGDSLPNEIPAGAVVLGGYIDVTTACLSATGTMAFQIEGAADLTSALAQAGLTTGLKAVTPSFTGSTAIKTTAKRSIRVVIATAAFTAGKLSVVLFYK
ncbi:hypothetical protein DEJ49_33530 [Streptomyces venezuelae]|uniref:Uncharacterized protein n=1 Tax=Streptomyces venezuelae TaxID=54571 RepID=A0A5P2CQS7_STRVZ|nr:hypothetical protein [Streptomyces venezuelae]QES45262.1 hypothetical protein DEJ49_33530 [Streptomyces venezuelae]